MLVPSRRRFWDVAIQRDIRTSYQTSFVIEVGFRFTPGMPYPSAGLNKPSLLHLLIGLALVWSGLLVLWVSWHRVQGRSPREYS